MKYYIFTFGCGANHADSERIARKLKALGHKKAVSSKEASLIVLNACSVRKSAIDRVYGKVKNLKNKQIILAGCLLDSDRKKLEKKVKAIWHPDEYFDLSPINETSFRALIPITKGCNNFCSYCAVPYTRGKEKSRPAKDIINEIKELIKNNYKEIWLLGQNVNSYKSGKTNFPKLLQKINKIEGNFWIKFTSPHPKDFSNELIQTIKKCEKVTNYINLPVQSGDNEILKKMNRKYTRQHYIKLVNKIKKAIPDVAISTDTIVGFPGETRTQFKNTLDLYKKIKFDMAFISQYSPRTGTVSARTMKDNIKHIKKEKRDKELTKVLAKYSLEKNKKLVGQTIKVLIDSQKDTNFFGRTEGNKIVKINKTDSISIGKFVDIKITKATSWKLEGEIAPTKIIVVLGPTSSGKSDLAVDIALQFPSEIISADSRQVYKHIPIGTGAITKKEMKGISHHLLGFVNPKKTYTAIDFKKDAEKAIKEILNKNKIPIICGGTGFYIQTLLSGNNLPKVKPNWPLRKKMEKKTAGQLFKQLQKLDPKRAKNIDSKNKRRLIRAIEIAIKLTKSDFDSSLPKSDFNSWDVLYLGIERKSGNLEKLIRKRILGLIKRGLLAEVKNLRKKKVSWKRIDELGFEYKYPAQYIREEINKEEMVEKILTGNNKYAKRQMTWFLKYTPKTIWVKNSKEAMKLSKKFLD